MSEVGYWLLVHASWNPFKPLEYLCLMPSYLGIAPVEITTKKIKLAHKFVSYDDAQQYADVSSKYWTPLLRLFDGEEPVEIR